MFTITILAILLYFIPCMVGIGKKNLFGIFILNVFLGWTFLGWVGALIWGVCSPKEEETNSFEDSWCSFGSSAAKLDAKKTENKIKELEAKKELNNK